MPDTTNQIKVSGNEVINTTVFPDTKLQTLDRRVGKDQLYFDRKLFEKSVAEWTGIPVIYHPDGTHPTDFKAVDSDPETAAEAIGGKLVGSVSNPRIVVPGGARLMAELDIDEDEEEIVSLWQQGRLFPSTAFMANSDGDRLTSPPVPNHVLLFPIRVDEVLPGDYGAFVNTLEVQSTMKEEKDKKETCTEDLPADEQTQENVMQIDSPEEVVRVIEEVTEEVADKASDIVELKTELDALKEEIAAIREAVTAEKPAEVTNSEEVVPEAVEEVTGIIDEEIKWRDEEIAMLKAELEALKAGKAALEEKIAGMEADAMEAEFNTIVEKMPVGMKATPEQIEELHTKYIAGDMKSLLHTVLNCNAQAGATQKVGQPFTQSTNLTVTSNGVGDLNKPRNKKE